MMVLDTDALGHLQKKDPVGLLIETGLDASADRDIRITVVSAYELWPGPLTPSSRACR